jgi:hypothetical protein
MTISIAFDKAGKLELISTVLNMCRTLEHKVGLLAKSGSKMPLVKENLDSSVPASLTYAVTGGATEQRD